MTVLKLSKSGKQLQIIDDFGTVYGIAVSAARNVLDGKVQSGHSVAMRLPFTVAPERFGVSPLWDPEGTIPATLPSSSISSRTNSEVTLSNDAFSPAVLKKEEKIKKFEDKEVW